MRFLTRGFVQLRPGHRSLLSPPVLLRKMSAQATLAKLTPLLRDLVSAAALDGSESFGKSEKDKVEVAQWIDKIAQGDIAKAENLEVYYLPVPDFLGE